MKKIFIPYEPPYVFPHEFFTFEDFPIMIEWGKVLCKATVVTEYYFPVDQSIRDENPEDWKDIEDPPKEKWGKPYYYLHLDYWMWGLSEKGILQTAIRSEHVDEMDGAEWKFVNMASSFIRAMDRQLTGPTNLVPLRHGDPQNERLEGFTMRSDYPELEFSSIATLNSRHVHFDIYEHNGTRVDTGTICFHRKGSSFSPDPVDTVEEADIYLQGDIKWDGCSNWHFDEQDDCWLHCCERDELNRFSQVMIACWDLTRKILPTWQDM